MATAQFDRHYVVAAAERIKARYSEINELLYNDMVNRASDRIEARVAAEMARHWWMPVVSRESAETIVKRSRPDLYRLLDSSRALLKSDSIRKANQILCLAKNSFSFIELTDEEALLLFG